MKTYSVITQERTYTVNSVYHFIHTVRPSWKDWSQITAVWQWVNGDGWNKVDPIDWVENHH